MRAELVAWLGTVDPALEIDVAGATEALLDVLHGRITAGNLAVYFAYILRNVVRYGECTLYIFRRYLGRYRRGCARHTELYHMAQSHVSALFSLRSFPPIARLEARCHASGIVGTAIAKMVKSVRATAHEGAMDGGEYIGFRNGVYDLCGDRFIPNDFVHYSVLVSMSTGYDYVTAEACPQETIDKIKEFYRTLFSDPSDPSDANLAAAWRFSGSLLTAERKCAVAFVGGGDSGKTAFTNLMHRTLGDYSAGMFLFRFRRSAHCSESPLRRMSTFHDANQI